MKHLLSLCLFGEDVRIILSILDERWTREKDLGRGRILSSSVVEGELVAGELVLLLAVFGDRSVELMSESRLVFATATKKINKLHLN